MDIRITDILPAGFRFVRRIIHQARKQLVVSERGYGPKGSGYYYNKNNPNRKSSITYYAKAVVPGAYTADNAAIRHTDREIFGFAGKARVTVD